jgi:transposase
VIKVFPQLSSLLIDEVIEDGLRLVVRARTPSVSVACPECDRLSERVHGYHVRRLADLPAQAVASSLSCGSTHGSRTDP